MDEFDYFTAFRRNLGFLDRDEQTRLRNARVAIPGLGGTGGAQVHALARLGIGKFSLADPDSFEMANFNRQLGATMHTLGKPKTEVARNIIHSINPEADVRTFEAGISPETIDAFLEDVDIVVDSLDFYCFQERFLLYKHARRRGLWVLTAPPLGFGFTLLAFDPDGMRFEDYFGFDEAMPLKELAVNLIAGISPKPYMFKYLHKNGLDVKQHQLPSVGAAPFLIGGIIAAQVTNLLTGKLPPTPVPTIVQYDALLQRYSRKTYRWGTHGPLQRLKKIILRRRIPL